MGTNLSKCHQEPNPPGASHESCQVQTLRALASEASPGMEGTCEVKRLCHTILTSSAPCTGDGAKAWLWPWPQSILGEAALVLRHLCSTGIERLSSFCPPSLLTITRRVLRARRPRRETLPFVCAPGRSALTGPRHCRAGRGRLPPAPPALAPREGVRAAAQPPPGRGSAALQQ